MAQELMPNVPQDVVDKIFTVSEEGVPVSERVTTVKAARCLFEKAKRSWETVAMRRSRLKGLVDGNPPYSPSRLKELGLSYVNNINTLEARAIIDQKAGAFYELFFEVPTLIEAKLAPGTNFGPTPVDYGQIVSEEFTRLLHDWTGFLVGMIKSRKEADVAGFGLMLFRDEWDWRPVAKSASHLLTDSMAEVDVSTFQYAFVRDNLTAGDMFRRAIKNPGAAKKAGWDPEAVKRVLVDIYVKEAQTALGAEKFQTSTWEGIQQNIRNNDFWTQSAEFETVRLVHLLVREIDTDEISHYIFTEKQLVSDPDLDKFLFRKVGRFEKMDHVLWIFPYNDGDGYLRSVRGLASMIEPHCDLSNRFVGRVFDAGFMTSSLILQPATQMDLSRLQLTRVGVMTIVPTGLNLIQSSFTPQIAPLVQLRELSANIMRNNTGVFKQVTEAFGENQVQKTAQQVLYEQGKEARLEKSNVAFDYTQIERLYREIFRRLTNPKYIMSKANLPGIKEARGFIGRCLLRGVPEGILMTPGAFEIAITRAIGMGSWGVKMDLTNQIMLARGAMDAIGARNALTDWLAVRVGYRNVSRYATNIDRNTIPSNDTSIATMENNDFAEGGQVPVGHDQEHLIHALTHAAPIVQLVQQYQQTRGKGMNIQVALAVLTNGLPHLEEHTKLLAQDPARVDMAKQLAEVIALGVKVHKALTEIVVEQTKMSMMDAQQRSQGARDQQERMMSIEQQMMQMEADKKFELEMAKQHSLNEARRVKTEEQMEIKRQNTAASLELQAQRQAAELAMKAQVTDADIALKRAKAE